MKLTSEMMKDLNDLKMLCYRRGRVASWSQIYRGGIPYVRFELGNQYRYVALTGNLINDIKDFLISRDIKLETESEAVERLLSEYES
jgi:hypothetical protein